MSHSGDIVSHPRGAVDTADRTFQTMLERSHQAFLVLVHERVAWANQAAARLVGLDMPGLLGRDLVSMVSLDHRRHVEQMQGLLQNRPDLPSLCDQVDLVRATGERVSVEIHFGRAVWQGVPAALVSVTDTTDRVRAEEASRRVATELEVSLHRLEATIEGTIAAMAALVDLRDPYTAGHQQRVASLASRIAVHLGLSRAEERAIRLAATIHDIGKIAIPSEILAKPGPISPLEMEMIRTHSRAGYDIIKDIELGGPVAEIVLQHHERLDGSGYPGGLRGDAILPESRVLAVADHLEAMASHRPYRPSQGFEAALASLERDRGTRFDSQVVDACLEIIRPEDVGDRRPFEESRTL